MVGIATVAGCGGRGLSLGKDGAAPAADGAVTDVGGAPEASSVFDGGGDQLIEALSGHAFVVNAAYEVPAGFALPATHTFTLVLDLDKGWAVAGSAQGGGESRIQVKNGGTVELQAPLSFSFDICGNGITYDHLTLTPSANGGIVGTASGRVSYATGDLLNDAKVTATFEGMPDHQTPALTLSPSTDPMDPFIPASLVASEPLTLAAAPVLLTAGGESSPLTPTARYMETFSFSGFGLPKVLLKYGETYRVAEAGLTDFAGNIAKAGPSFTTRPAPPLIVEDGFESVAAQTLGGAIVADGTNAPVLAGKRSLYVPPSGGGEGPVSQLALRLAVNPGDTVIRFSYRVVGLNSSPFGAVLSFLVAGAGTPVAGRVLPADTQPRTEFRLSPQTVVYVSAALEKAELPLPAGTHGEVFLDRVGGSSWCGLPPPPTLGIVIDDLRVE